MSEAPVLLDATEVPCLRMWAISCSNSPKLNEEVGVESLALP